MSDFTKKELETIVESLDRLYFGEFYAKEEYPKIYNKIQSMIENHDKPCTHKKLRRISFLNGQNYDICGNCDYIKRMK